MTKEETMRPIANKPIVKIKLNSIKYLKFFKKQEKRKNWKKQKIKRKMVVLSPTTLIVILK